MERPLSTMGLGDHEESTNDSEDRISCPCHQYNSMMKVEEVLKSNDQVQAMIQWLDGETDAEALRVQKILSCGKRSRCRYRYGTSFAILNSIRDACRNFLEPQQGEATKQQTTSQTANRAELSTASFETSFPPLGGSAKDNDKAQIKPHPAASNILIPRKKNPKKTSKESSVSKTNTNSVNTLVGKKKKKRIRPHLTQATTVPQNSVWGQQVSNLGNKEADVPKLTANNHVVSLESRMSAPLKVANAWGGTKPPTVHLTEKPQSVTMRAVSVNPPATDADQASIVVQPKFVSESPESHVSRLLKIYIALIKNMLVPSTAMELHFLIRLLAVDGENCQPATVETVNPAGVFFRSIFSTPERCNTFVVDALSALSDVVKNLSLPLLQLLIQCVPFRNKCSSLERGVSAIVEDRIGRGLGIAKDDIGTHAILSLPFEEGRDSRHNYKTQGEMSIYKNREETRDLFLHQLRVYMSEKGKGFQSQDMENAKENLRRESRKIIGSIFSVNMPWFAEFLCELLLQVGLSPVQETDEELLNIADKDKLQKLHKRFSSRTSRTNKSSKKLVLAKRKELSANSPWKEAQVSFPGYQEFFFIFLISADSFNLGVHFRNHLVSTILGLSSNHEVNHLEKRILDLQILARFLGFLIFSPNWHDSGLELSKMYPNGRAMKVSGGMQQLEYLGVSCTTIIEDSWLQGISLLTVPWITELLRMAKWDSLSLTSREYRQVLANLRALQSRLRFGSAETALRFGPSMELVSFSLESFFQSIIGLPKLTSLPIDNLPEAKHLPEKCLDVTPLGICMGSTIASSQHIEDLSNLMRSLNSSSIGKSPTKTRKLRPSIVSRSLNVETDGSMKESPFKRASASEWQPSTGASWNELGRESTGDIQRRLQDAFFHQNHDLKEICEFAVGQVLKKTINQQVLHSYCKQAFDEQVIVLSSSEKDIEQARSHAMHLSNGILRQSLQDSVETALKVLGPSDLDDKVLEVATSLAVTSGTESGKPLLHALVLKELDAFMSALKREEKKQLQLPRKILFADEDEPNFEDAISALGAFYDYVINNSSKWNVEDILQNIESSLDGLVKLESSMGNAIAEELSLRKLFEVLFNVDAMSVDFLDWCMSLGSEDKCIVLPKYFRLTVHFSKHTSFGLRNLSARVDEEILKSLVASWPEGPDTTKELASLLMDLEDSQIFQMKMVRTSLKETGSSISTEVLNILEKS